MFTCAFLFWSTGKTAGVSFTGPTLALKSGKSLASLTPKVKAASMYASKLSKLSLRSKFLTSFIKSSHASSATSKPNSNLNAASKFWFSNLSSKDLTLASLGVGT